MIRIEILGRMPTLNQYRNYNHWQHSKEKNNWTEIIRATILAEGIKKIDTPMTLNVTSYTKRLRDTDNTVVSVKYFSDTLKAMGLIPDDNPDYIPYIILQSKKTKGEEKTVFIIQ